MRNFHHNATSSGGKRLQRLTRWSILLCVAAAVVPCALFAGGLESVGGSARSVALGGAIMASISDVTSLHANPGVLSFLKGTELSIGTTVEVPEFRFTGVAPSATTTRMESQVLFPPNFYLSHTFDNGVGLGICATLPFMLRNEWQSDWVGKNLATRAELRTVAIAPSLSVKLNPRFSIGVSLVMVFARMQLNRGIGVVGAGESDSWEAAEELIGSGHTAYGMQAGMLYQMGAGLSLAATYRSRVWLNVEDGTAKYSGVPDALQELFPDGQASSSLVLPEEMRLGVSWHPAKWISVGADLEYALWSECGGLAIAYQTGALAANPVLMKSIGGRWENTLNARCGLEASLLGVVLRAGYAYDPTPIPDRFLTPLAPDANRRTISAGLGYTVSDGLQLDFAYGLQLYADRGIENSAVEYQPGRYFNGTYTGKSSVVAMNVTYQWN